MALARFFYKHRRSILTILLWCFAILSLLQWQQKKIRRRWRHENKRDQGFDYGSGEEAEIDANLEILLAKPDSPEKPRRFEKDDLSVKIKDVQIKEVDKRAIPNARKTEPISCSITEGVDWKTVAHPKYATDPGKFLIPVFTYGPNNQLHGFREAIFMAIKLNRTIIAPPFFKHSRNDVTASEDGDEVVQTFLRLDVNALRSLVSTISSTETKRVCGGAFDAFYTTRSAYCSNTKITRLMASCKYLDIECTIGDKFIVQGSEHGVKYCPKPLIPIFPPYDTIPKTGKGAPFTFIEDLSKINSFYTSPHTCPVLGYPYRGISFHKTLEGPRHQGKISRIDREIMRDIVAMTPRPKHVRDSISKFLSARIRRDYIAMHWRYNDDDWSMHCKTNHGNQKTCNKILEIMHDASRMGKFFVDYLAEIKKEKNIDIMYIAAPPDEMEMLNRVKIEIMKMLPSVEIYLSTQLLPFLDDYFQSEGCENYEENRFEILSLAEMEICSRADIFLRSAGSSWSMNINLERVIKDINRFDLQNTALLEEDD